MSAAGEKWQTPGWQSIAWRWMKFNLVGWIGIGVQLAVLTALKSGLHFNYLWATALAVEAAVIHNYLWHQRFTWVDRPAGSEILRFARFNLTTGVFSIAGNLALMKLLVDVAHVQYLLANIITIATCSLLNFVVSDRLVFKVSPTAE
jgi:putative flippase GtrA